VAAVSPSEAKGLRWRGVLLSFVALVMLGYGAACGYLWVAQRQLIFEPSPDVLKTPADLQLHFVEVWVSNAGGDPAPLNGWWLPGDEATAPVLLYLHGNDLNIAASLDPVARLRKMGFSVLIVDYRGFGRSGGGFPSEGSVYEDAETAWQYLVRELRADPRRIFIYGHSLGGAVAIELASHHPEAAGLIVEATFTSMRDLAPPGYRAFPLSLLLNQRFDNLAKIGALRVPVLIIHGTADTLVPHAMSDRLFQAAPQPKRLLSIPGAGHDDIPIVGGAAYADGVRGFVAASAKR
jgi:fermentation-respiration switch protein FrsA (DUF1100 family)